MNKNERVKISIKGAIIGFIMSWAANYFFAAIPETKAANALGNGLSGFITGFMVLFMTLTFDLKNRLM